MTLFDLFARDAVGPLDLASAPSDQQTAHLRKRAQELVDADARLRRAEALVETIKARRTLLATRVLPDLMDAAMTDTIGLPEAGVDVVVVPFVSAGIGKDVDPEVREKMFQHLETLGGGSLPKASVFVNFSKEDLPRARKFVDAASAWISKAFGNETGPGVGLELSVHHGTLTSWLKSELEAREERAARGETLVPLDLGLLGATVGRICKVRVRKEKRASKRK
jgi:hypothetical protein